MNLAELQLKVNGRKNKANDFAGFNYRNVEAILAQVKPLLPEGAFFGFSDEIIEVAGHPFLVATASLTFADGTTYKATSAALHALTKKGMDPAQITGSCSTYARKYALQGLLAIDDGSVDPDAAKSAYEPDDGPTDAEKRDEMKAALGACRTVSQLAALWKGHDFNAAWKALPPDMQSDVESEKDRLKMSLQQEAA